MRRALPSLTGLVLLCACAPDRTETEVPAAVDSPAAPAAAHELDRLVLVTDAAGSLLGLEAMLDQLAEYDVVFVGETHLDDTTHRVEHAIYEGMLARRDGRVVLSMEMFQRDVQPHLDAYVAGEIDEATFLANARPWHNYRTAYRPLIETARAGKHPVVGANLPASLQRKLGRGGARAWGELSAEERALVPAEILDGSEGYWERVGQTLRDAGHGGAVPEDPDARRFAVQNLWDNSMGDAVARALHEHPEHQVVHVVGGFHVEFHQGTVDQLRRRDPDAKVAVVSVMPASDLADVEPGPTDRADFMVFASARARGPQDGRLAVTVPVEQRYRLHMPPGHAPDAPLPLLVWLTDDATPADDAYEYWTRAVGEHAMVLVVDPSHPVELPDLRLGGRWAWGPTADADLDRGVRSLERILEYVSRRLPVAPDQVVVAGRGSGGTVAAWTALYADLPERMGRVAMLAWGPDDWERLATAPLSDVGGPDRRLTLAGDPASSAPVEASLREAGMDVKAQERGASDGELHAIEEALRADLGAPPLGSNAGPATWLVLPEDTPAGRTWADLHARVVSGLDDSPVIWVPVSALAAGHPIPETRGRLEVRIEPLRTKGPPGPMDFGPESFVDGRGLPLAPGAFGGTTVLVIPKGASKAARAAWQQLATDDVLNQRSRFHHLAVAFEDGEPGLPQVLDQIRQSHRRNVLIVPAAFAASPETVARLRDQARAAGDGLDLSFEPGLGADLIELR